MGCMQSTPVAEPIPAPASSPDKIIQDTTVPAPPVSAPLAPATEVASVEPEVEVAPASQQVKLFTINGVSITEQGIVQYHVQAADGSVAYKRRFNDFKALYAQLGAVSAGLPALPESGLSTVFRGGRHSQELIKQRETAFAAILNAIANTPALAESAAFQKFTTS